MHSSSRLLQRELNHHLQRLILQENCNITEGKTEDKGKIEEDKNTEGKTEEVKNIAHMHSTLALKKPERIET